MFVLKQIRKKKFLLDILTNQPSQRKPVCNISSDDFILFEGHHVPTKNHNRLSYAYNETQILGNEFINEASINNLLRLFTLPKTHFVCAANSCWSSQLFGNILMPYSGVPFEDELEKCSVYDIQSIIVRSMLALVAAQDTIQLKHHDLHSGNVFIMKRPLQEDIIHASGFHLRLPSSSYSCKIADFGFSAATDPRTGIRFERVDYSRLDVNPRIWGEWNGSLEGNEGYDVVTLLGSLRTECRGKAKKWVEEVMREIREAVKPLTLRVSSVCGRPLTCVPLSPRKMLDTLNSFRPFHIQTQDA